MQRLPWTSRTFHFDLPEGWIFNILERLEGTHVRIESMMQGIDEQFATHRLGGKWSLKDHIGHLTDLESLHDGRIEDFLNRKNILRAADMQNLKTEQAGHQEKMLATLMEEFRNVRHHFIQRFRALDDETLRFQSLHPRLQVPMKPVDMAFFVAEHDDHHLASMREILLNHIQ